MREVVKCEYPSFLLHTCSLHMLSHNHTLSSPSQYAAERVVYHVVHFGDVPTSDVLKRLD